jgi:TRAP-type C4-dicarboxylate transport system permease small subunit
MFAAFCVQIVCRYLFDFQFEWTYECTVIGFMWATVFGACRCAKIGDHVSFNLLYVRLGRRGRAVMDLVGGLIALAAFGLLIVPSMDFVAFMGIKATPVLKVKFSVVYAPFPFFLLFSLCYVLRGVLRAAGTLLSGPQNETGETGDRETPP